METLRIAGWICLCLGGAITGFTMNRKYRPLAYAGMALLVFGAIAVKG